MAIRRKKIKREGPSGLGDQSGRDDNKTAAPPVDPMDADDRRGTSHPIADSLAPKAAPSDSSIGSEALSPEPETVHPKKPTPDANIGRGENPIPSDSPSPEEGNDLLELLSFRMADEIYAVDLLMIREIIRPTDITQVPRAHHFIKGIISLRGTIIPVFDLRSRLGLREAPLDRSSRILVVHLEKGHVGVIADQVFEVLRVDPSRMEPPPAAASASGASLFKAVCHQKDRMLILLDLERSVEI